MSFGHVIRHITVELNPGGFRDSRLSDNFLRLMPMSTELAVPKLEWLALVATAVLQDN